jgi:hypothetical protein
MGNNYPRLKYKESRTEESWILYQLIVM